MNELDKAINDVYFEARLSNSEYCLCNGCGSRGRVAMITLPQTQYHDAKNLTTHYVGYWICQECFKKLQRAMETIDSERS